MSDLKAIDISDSVAVVTGGNIDVGVLAGLLAARS